MTATLAQVRQIWPKAKYAPRPDCKFCSGSGERAGHPGFPCICIFVAPDIVDTAADILSTVARRELDKLQIK